MKVIKYSICVCNYNMGDTIEQALTSILEQLDDTYEVLVIDDGSTDNSLYVLEKLSKKYSILRYIHLKRDKHRLLGETRNISIREARGVYVLPQFDCDDVYEVCIKDFVEVFHQLEACIKQDFYLKGSKLNIGKREFMLKYGPYRNMFKEDRDMWIRLASQGKLIPLIHNNIFTRLPKTKPESLRRAIFKTWAHLQADYRSKLKLLDPLKKLFSRKSGKTYSVRILRCVLSPFAYITAEFMKPLPLPEVIPMGSLREYWTATQGTFTELMQRYNGKPDSSRLTTSGRIIFISRETNSIKK